MGIFNDSGLEEFLCLNFSDCDVPCCLENDQVENFFLKTIYFGDCKFHKMKKGLEDGLIP